MEYFTRMDYQSVQSPQPVGPRYHTLSEWRLFSDARVRLRLPQFGTEFVSVSPILPFLNTCSANLGEFQSRLTISLQAANGRIVSWIRFIVRHYEYSFIRRFMKTKMVYKRFIYSPVTLTYEYTTEILTLKAKTCLLQEKLSTVWSKILINDRIEQASISNTWSMILPTPMSMIQNRE